MKKQNSNIEKRIKEMLSKMTLREKAGQCVMIEPCFCLESLNNDHPKEKYTDILDKRFLDKLFNEYHIGFVLFGGVSTIGDDTPKAWVEYVNTVDAFISQTKLKIPMLYGADAVHGVNFLKSSTIFSHNLAVTSTFNPELAKAYSSVVADELKSIGVNFNFAPNIDVARDQRWGRVYESLGEDSYVASVFSKALVEGMQDNGQVSACAKHFIGYGESANGMDRSPADITERSILENHLPPFEAAIKSGVHGIMVNGADVNGMPMPASKKLLKDFLRDTLRFEGVTISDWEDVSRLQSRHKITNSYKDSVKKAFNAGLDMNMAVSDLKTVDIMEELVNSGEISMERLNEAVSNVLRVKFNLGLFEKDAIDPIAARKASGSIESREIAQQIARESIILLKNENNILPLSKDIKSILITGPKADSKRHLCGGWTHSWGSADEQDLSCATVLDEIRESVSPDARLFYVETEKELKKLKLNKGDFDVCICVVGEEPHSEWLGDSSSLAIEKEEEALLIAARNTGLPTVMVSLLARPMNITWVYETMDSILWAFTPGTEGAKPIVEALFGDFNPSGKTTISFPRSSGQIPIVYNARRYECAEMNTKYEPLIPFGYGLSYTEFSYSNLKVDDVVKVGSRAKVSVDVTNSGSCDGSEVILLYLMDVYACVTRPFKSLKSFKKIELKVGETKTVLFELGELELGLYDENLTFVQDKRTIEVQIDDLKKEFIYK